MLNNQVATAMKDGQVTHVIIGGTYFPIDCDPRLARTLSRLIHSRIRVKLTYKDDSVEYGYIGRSTGPQKIPLLVYNSRSLGGPVLSPTWIKRIDYSNKKNGGVIYQS